MARVNALIEPPLLVWARQTAGLEIAEAAAKAHIEPARLVSWERGEAHPTIAQLRELGRVYKRPLAVFYLPKPPRDFQPLRDFRRMPGKAPPSLSPQLRFEVRRCRDRRDLALELHRATEGEPPVLSIEASLHDDPEAIGTKIRRRLGITYEDQLSWQPGHHALRVWRTALERAGVLVFQASRIDVDEMRGFSLSERVLPAIVLNIKDAPSGRIFTMLHELTHVFLRAGGLCDLGEQANKPSEERELEIFCNRVAGAALVPRENLLKEDVVRAVPHKTAWTDEGIRTLANRYAVSREVLLRRLLILDRTTEAFYRAKRKQYQSEAQGSTSSGFAPPHILAVSTAGALFVRLVLQNYYQDRITASDVSDFLAIRLRHLSKIETEVLGAPGVTT